MQMIVGRNISCWALLTICAIVVGCAPDKPADRVGAANDVNIRRVANLYQSFQSRSGWVGPVDEAAFRKFISEFPAHRLEMMSVDPNDLDRLFKSERDGEPFEIRYGIRGSLGGIAPIVFERLGEAGKRQVAFTNGTLEEVDEVRYRTLFNDPGHASAHSSASQDGRAEAVPGT